MADVRFANRFCGYGLDWLVKETCFLMEGKQQYEVPQISFVTVDAADVVITSEGGFTGHDHEFGAQGKTSVYEK